MAQRGPFLLTVPADRQVVELHGEQRSAAAWLVVLAAAPPSCAAPTPA